MTIDQSYWIASGTQDWSQTSDDVCGAGERRLGTLVVGGGLIGGHVAVALAEAGHEVTVVSRSFNPWLLDRVAVGTPISLVEQIVAPTDELTARIDAADIVFCMAGASTPSQADRNLMSSTLDSLPTALTVLDLMRETSTRRVVLASSGGTVYGEPIELPTPESHPLEPVSMHGMNSVAIENYARYFARRHGLHVTMLRYANVYGPGQTGRRGQGVIANWCTALLREEPITVFGGLGGRRDFVFVEDAAEATVAAALTPAAGQTFNVGSSVGTPLAEVLELVSAAAGREARLERRPGRGLDVSATALDCSRLERATGWAAATPLADGIRRSWEWLAGDADGRSVATRMRPPAENAHGNGRRQHALVHVRASARA
jgi:UDP-glucose 4-epimerase